MDHIVTNNILSDICFRITGQKKFSVDFVDNEYEDDCLPKSLKNETLSFSSVYKWLLNIQSQIWVHFLKNNNIALY